jgi:hypothetical protein
MGPEAANFLNFSANKVGMGRYYRYSTTYTRNSGDPHTSIHNYWLNVISHAWCFRMMSLDLKYYLFALGDDVVIAFDGDVDVVAVAAALPPMMLKLGFISEPLVQEPVSFCSAYFIPMKVNGRNTYVLTPDVRRVLSKVGFSLDNITPVNAYIEKCASLTSIASLACVPLTRVLIPKMLEHVHGQLPRPISDDDRYKLMHNVGCNVLEPNLFTEDVYLQLLGVSRPEVVALEQFLYNVVHSKPATLCILHHPVLAIIAKHWLGKPYLNILPSPRLPTR